MRLLLIPALIFVSGCAPETGDYLVDQVAAREEPFASCIVVGQTHVFKVDAKGPPALLTPARFKSPEVRRAAASVAIPWQTVKHGDARFFGKGAPEDCVTGIHLPVYANDFAFVTFHGSGGGLGAYAFRRVEGRWRKEEKVALGYW